MTENHAEEISKLMSPINTHQITLFNSIIELNKLFYSFEKIKALSGCDEAFLVMIYKVCNLDYFKISGIEKKMDLQTKKRLQLFENIYKTTNGIKLNNVNTNSKDNEIEEEKLNVRNFGLEELNNKAEDSISKKRKREESVSIEENSIQLQDLEWKDNQSIFSNDLLLLSKEKELELENRLRKIGKLKPARVFKEFGYYKKRMIHSIIRALEPKADDPIIGEISTLIPIFIKYDQILYSIIQYPADFKAFDRQQLFRDLLKDKERIKVKLKEFTLLQQKQKDCLKLIDNSGSKNESQIILSEQSQMHEHEDTEPVTELEFSSNDTENHIVKNSLSSETDVINIINSESTSETVHSDSRAGLSNFDDSKWVGNLVIDISEDEIIETQGKSHLHEKEEEIRILKEQIEKLEREKVENLKNKKAKLQVISRAEEICDGISKKKSQMDKVTTRCSELNRDIDDLMKRIDRSQAELSQCLEILDVLQLEIEQEEIKKNNLTSD